MDDELERLRQLALASKLSRKKSTKLQSPVLAQDESRQFSSLPTTDSTTTVNSQQISNASTNSSESTHLKESLAGIDKSQEEAKCTDKLDLPPQQDASSHVEKAVDINQQSTEVNSAFSTNITEDAMNQSELTKHVENDPSSPVSTASSTAEKGEDLFSAAKISEKASDPFSALLSIHKNEKKKGVSFNQAVP
jgi:hypothetical protein